MNRLKSFKSSTCYSETSFLLPATNVPNHWLSFLSINADDQNSVLNFVEIEGFLLLQEVMCKYTKTQVSPYDHTKIAIHSIWRPDDDRKSNCGQNFKKTVSYRDIVHFIDE